MSCFKRLLVAGLALAHCASLAAAGSGTADHLLLRETPVPGGLSIAFVGDGFDADGLPTYGKVVNTFVERLLTRDLFDTHRARFNFYRIDVVDPTGVTECLCDEGSHAKVTDVSVLGNSGPLVDGTKEIDLEVQHCWNGGDDPILDTYKQFEAIELAQNIPDLKVVVIVANARLPSGDASPMVNPQDTTVVVVGAHVSETALNSDLYEIDEIAVATLTHELGHALGLLDEYDHLNTPAPPEFQECRNVWQPDAAPQWPGPPTWPASEKPVPWQGVLVNCCSHENMARCQADAAGDCGLQDLEVAESYCSFVPADETCDPPLECDLFPGAWEGAFYAKTGYYRARQHCRMESMGVKQHFCEACRQYLDIYLEHFGANASSGPWPEERCQSPGCPSAEPPVQLPATPGDVWRSDEH